MRQVAFDWPGVAGGDLEAHPATSPISPATIPATSQRRLTGIPPCLISSRVPKDDGAWEDPSRKQAAGPVEGRCIPREGWHRLAPRVRIDSRTFQPLLVVAKGCDSVHNEGAGGSYRQGRRERDDVMQTAAVTRQMARPISLEELEAHYKAHEELVRKLDAHGDTYEKLCEEALEIIRAIREGKDPAGRR